MSGRALLVIYNPCAGRRARRNLEQTVAALRREGACVTVQETLAPGDAERIARETQAPVDAVVAAGGDGTVNEVLNGLVARRPATSPALGIIPIGTTNVLARELGLPAAGTPELARVLLGAETRSIYLGACNGRCFALMSGVGFDAHVVERTSPWLKRRIGKLAYVLQSLRELAFYKRREYFVMADAGRPVRAATVVVAKSRHYGGSFRFAARAGIDVPELEVCLFIKGGRWPAALALLALLSGRMERVPGYRTFMASQLRISGPVGDPVQLDGDVLACLPATLEVVRPAIAVLAPPPRP